MDKLNVCLMNDSFPPLIDGVANAVVNYGEFITREHGSAAVVTPYYPDADDTAYPFPVVRYPSLDLTKAVGYRAGMPLSPELMRRLEGMQFNIIHSHCPIVSALLARGLREQIRVPVVLTYHTKFDIDIANALRSELLREEAARLLVQNIAACDEVWTVSAGAGENLRKLGYEGDYLVMPNGVDFPRGRVSQELIDRVAEGFDLPAGVPVFLFVGRMMWYKGLRIILDALKALWDEGRDFRMVFVGGGVEKDEIVAYCRSLGLEGPVQFADAVRDRELVRAWYCRADLFLFPSTFDTNGLVVREAAACALPSVLVEGSCAAEGVEDGNTGFLIQENAESLAAKLRQLCRRPEVLRQVGERAQRELYISWQEAVGRACDRYETVIENFRLGLYPEHDRPTDSLVRSLARTVDVLGRGRERRQEALREMETGYQELRAELEEERQRAKDRTRQVLNELETGAGELKEELKEELDEERRRLKERLEDVAQRVDKFL